jgi:DNA replication protein DnaC
MKKASQDKILLLCNFDMEKFDFSLYDYTKWLVFCWPTGTWKTHTANKILEKFSEKQKKEWNSTKFDFWSITDWRFKQLVKSNQLVLRKPDEYQTDIAYYPLEMMVRYKMFLYDDIWVSDASDAYIRDLTFILDERINKKLITIFTTNLSKNELSEKLNDRIVSRMLLNSDIIIFSWEDMRLKNTKIYSI